jgi:hypothetical protein
VTGRQERRCKQLLDNLKEKNGYWKLEDKAYDHTPWRSCFERGYGSVIRENSIELGTQSLLFHDYYSSPYWQSETKNAKVKDTSASYIC